MDRSTGTTYGPLYRHNIWTALQAQHMLSSTEEIFQEIAKDFNIRWNFPNCVGSIDGKHIRIKCPPNSGSHYFNYKPYHCIVLQAVVGANLKFVTVDIGAYGKQSDGGLFPYSALYQSLETRSLKLPEDTVLPNSEITLPYVFVGDEAYPLTTYLMKPYKRRTLDRSKTIFNYRLSRARRVVECTFGICASEWRILDKAIEAKVGTAVEIVKCIALLHNIIIDVEGLHDLSSNDCSSLDTNDGSQLKKSRIHNSVTASAKQTRDLFFKYLNSPAGSVLWQEEAIRDVQ